VDPATTVHHSALETSNIPTFLQDFFSQTPSWAIANSGKGAVVYDTVALTTHPLDLKTAIFDFVDGSTLSLVGLPVALPHSLFA
jgi:hypothetical protein